MKNKGKENRSTWPTSTKESTTDELWETVVRSPVVQQVIKHQELVEVLPVITRDRERTEVHEILKPTHEREVMPPVMSEKELPEIEREKFLESREGFEKEYNEMTKGFKSSVKVEDLEQERIMKEPIVNEIVHKKVLDEIQPVIHKETLVSHVTVEKQPIRERVVEAPSLIQENMDQYTERLLNREEGVEVETVEKKPIYTEVVRPKEIVEVQPIIDRVREVTEVHRITKSINTQEISPTTVEEKELAFIENPDVVESREEFEGKYRDLDTERRSNNFIELETFEVERIVKQPIVHEIIHKKVIEEIQPIIHKETIVPHIVREYLPIHEKIIEAPKLFREELEEESFDIAQAL